MQLEDREVAARCILNRTPKVCRRGPRVGVPCRCRQTLLAAAGMPSGFAVQGSERGGSLPPLAYSSARHAMRSGPEWPERWRAQSEPSPFMSPLVWGCTALGQQRSKLYFMSK